MYVCPIFNPPKYFIAHFAKKYSINILSYLYDKQFEKCIRLKLNISTYCILRGQIREFNHFKTTYHIVCSLVVIELWLGSYIDL